MTNCEVCHKNPGLKRRVDPLDNEWSLCIEHAQEFDEIAAHGLSEDRDNPFAAMMIGDSPEWTI